MSCRAMSHHAVSRRVVRRGMSRHAVRCRVAPRRVIPDGNGGIDGNGVTRSSQSRTPEATPTRPIRDRAAQLDAPRPQRSPTPRGSTPRAARGRRGCRRSQRPAARAKSQNLRAHANTKPEATPTRPRGAARRAAPVAQPDAARLDAARRVRPPQMPKKPEASGRVRA